MSKEKESKYGRPPTPKERPEPRKRLPQYDECLKEFLVSGDDIWVVDMDALPSQKSRVVLSSLKWRIKNKPEFRGLRVFMNKDKVYLEKETIGKGS